MKSFKPTQEMINAAETVFLAMAFTKTIRPVVVGYQTAILAKHQFHIAKEWRDHEGDEIILDPNLSYLLEDSDFQTYHKECNEARKAANLYVEDEDFCPLLVAEHLEMDAKHAMVAALEPLTGISLERITGNMDRYKEYMDLTLRLMAKFVRNADDILKAA